MPSNSIVTTEDNDIASSILFELDSNFFERYNAAEEDTSEATSAIPPPSRKRNRLPPLPGPLSGHQKMANLFDEFSVYLVEVCRTCSWNHLVQSYVLGKRGLEKPRRRTAAE